MIDSPQPVWHRSSRCGNTTCVEVARVGDDYLIRDSKDPSVPPLRFPREAWKQFLAAVHDGEFD